MPINPNMPPVESKASLGATFLHIRNVTLQRGVNTIFSNLTLDLTEPRIGLILSLIHISEPTRPY